MDNLLNKLNEIVEDKDFLNIEGKCLIAFEDKEGNATVKLKAKPEWFGGVLVAVGQADPELAKAVKLAAKKL